MKQQLQLKIRAIPDQGFKRVLAIFKFAIKEIPQLITEIESKNPDVQKRAVEEGRWLLEMLQTELTQGQLIEGMSLEEFNAALNNPANFSPEEWRAFSSLPKHLSKHSLVPKPKVKKPRFPRYPKA